MKQKILFCTLILSLVTTLGCRWRDDFRDRQQPQLLEQPLRPTLNPDSKDYAGDDTNVEHDMTVGVPLPEIDKLTTIPESPAYPAGASGSEQSPRKLTVQQGN